MACFKFGEIFHDLRRSSIFRPFDLFEGNWQTKIDKACTENTTFICKFATYQFEVKSFELKRSGAAFQRMMDNIY